MNLEKAEHFVWCLLSGNDEYIMEAERMIDISCEDFNNVFCGMVDLVFLTKESRVFGCCLVILEKFLRESKYKEFIDAEYVINKFMDNSSLFFQNVEKIVDGQIAISLFSRVLTLDVDFFADNGYWFLCERINNGIEFIAIMASSLNSIPIDVKLEVSELVFMILKYEDEWDYQHHRLFFSAFAHISSINDEAFLHYLGKLNHQGVQYYIKSFSEIYPLRYYCFISHFNAIIESLIFFSSFIVKENLIIDTIGFIDILSQYSTYECQRSQLFFDFVINFFYGVFYVCADENNNDDNSLYSYASNTFSSIVSTVSSRFFFEYINLDEIDLNNDWKSTFSYFSLLVEFDDILFFSLFDYQTQLFDVVMKKSFFISNSRVKSLAFSLVSKMINGFGDSFEYANFVKIVELCIKFLHSDIPDNIIHAFLGFLTNVFRVSTKYDNSDLLALLFQSLFERSNTFTCCRELYFCCIEYYVIMNDFNPNDFILEWFNRIETNGDINDIISLIKLFSLCYGNKECEKIVEHVLSIAFEIRRHANNESQVMNLDKSIIDIIDNFQISQNLDFSSIILYIYHTCSEEPILSIFNVSLSITSIPGYSLVCIDKDANNVFVNDSSLFEIISALSLYNCLIKNQIMLNGDMILRVLEYWLSFDIFIVTVIHKCFTIIHNVLLFSKDIALISAISMMSVQAFLNFVFRNFQIMEVPIAWTVISLIIGKSKDLNLQIDIHQIVEIMINQIKNRLIIFQNNEDVNDQFDSDKYRNESLIFNTLFDVYPNETYFSLVHHSIDFFVGFPCYSDAFSLYSLIFLIALKIDRTIIEPILSQYMKIVEINRGELCIIALDTITQIANGGDISDGAILDWIICLRPILDNREQYEDLEMLLFDSALSCLSALINSSIVIDPEIIVYWFSVLSPFSSSNHVRICFKLLANVLTKDFVYYSSIFGIENISIKLIEYYPSTFFDHSLRELFYPIIQLVLSSLPLFSKSKEILQQFS